MGELMGVVLSPALSVNKCCLALLIFMNEFLVSQTARAFQRERERARERGEILLYIIIYLHPLTYFDIFPLKLTKLMGVHLYESFFIIIIICFMMSPCLFLPLLLLCFLCSSVFLRTINCLPPVMRGLALTFSKV